MQLMIGQEKYPRNEAEKKALNPQQSGDVTRDSRARFKYSEPQVTVRKHPVSIALSNRVLEKIDKEA